MMGCSTFIQTHLVFILTPMSTSLTDRLVRGDEPFHHPVGTSSCLCRVSRGGPQCSCPPAAIGPRLRLVA